MEERKGRGVAPRLFHFLPIFTRERGRYILRSSFAGSCIDCPPETAMLAAEARSVASEKTTYCVRA